MTGEAVKDVLISARPIGKTGRMVLFFAIIAVVCLFPLCCLYPTPQRDSSRFVRTARLHSFVAEGRHVNSPVESCPEGYVKALPLAKYVVETGDHGKQRYVVRDDGSAVAVLDLGGGKQGPYFVAFENGVVAGPLTSDAVVCLQQGKSFELSWGGFPRECRCRLIDEAGSGER